MSLDPTRPASLCAVPVPADLDDRFENRRAITRVLRSVPDVVLCESCGRRPAVEVVPAVEDAETSEVADVVVTASPFQVCVDCAAPSTALAPSAPTVPAAAETSVGSRSTALGERGTITSADPTSGSDPCDPAWAGTVRIRRRWTELVWPAVFCLGAPVGALNAWLLSGNPVVMVAAGVITFVGILVADHRRDRRADPSALGRVP